MRRGTEKRTYHRLQTAAGPVSPFAAATPSSLSDHSARRYQCDRGEASSRPQAMLAHLPRCAGATHSSPSWAGVGSARRWRSGAPRSPSSRPRASASSPSTSPLSVAHRTAVAVVFSAPCHGYDRWLVAQVNVAKQVVVRTTQVLALRSALARPSSRSRTPREFSRAEGPSRRLPCRGEPRMGD